MAKHASGSSAIATFLLCLLCCGASLLAAPCITFELSSSNTTCYGTNDGFASVQVVSGSGPFTYLWTSDTFPLGGNAYSSTISNLPSGIYNITIRDSVGCAVSGAVQIYSPADIEITFQSTPVTCAGRSDGTLTVTASGGIAPYIYNNSAGGVSPPSSSFTFTNLIATVLDTPTLVIYDDAVNVPLFQDWSWAITRTMRSSVLPYSGQYSISYTPYNYDGIYFHCDQCMDTNLYSGISFYVNGYQDGGQMLQFAVSDEDTVYGTRNILGSDKAVLPPTTWIHVFFDLSWVPANQYSGFRIWDLSGLTNNSELFIDEITVVPRPHASVLVTDAKGCSKRENYTIDAIPALEISVLSRSPSCHGSSDGALNVTVSGGVGPYSYVWIPTYETGHSLSNIKATANYSFSSIYTDDLVGFYDQSVGNVISDSSLLFFSGKSSLRWTPFIGSALLVSADLISLSNYYGIEFWFYSTQHNPQVSFALAYYQNSTATVTPYGVTNFRSLVNFSAIISNQWMRAFYDFSALPSGVRYNGILLSGSTRVIIYLDEINFVLRNSDVPYDPSAVEAYYLQVTDVNACQLIQGISLSQPDVLQVEAFPSYVKCYGNFDGAFSSSVSGGTYPYSYSWTIDPPTSQPQSNSVVSKQPPSRGYLDVEDLNRCSATSNTVYIRQPPPMAYEYSTQLVSCYGKQDGVVTFSALGGAPPYELTVTNFASHYLNVLPVYVYNDDVEDPFYNFSLPESGTFQDSSVGAQSGYYSMSFSPSDFEGLGLTCNACITTNDYLGISFWIFVEGDEEISLEFGVINGSKIESAHDPLAGVFHYGNFTGNWTEVTYNLDLNATQWDTFYIKDISGASSTSVKIYVDSIELIPRWYSTKPYYTNVPAGFQGTFVGGAAAYYIIVTDQNGCELNATVVILQPEALQMNFSLIKPSSKFSADGQITITPIGGVQPYSYNWGTQLNQYGPVATGLVIGSYYIEIKDANGCSTVQTIVLQAGVDGLAIVKHNDSVTLALGIVVGFCTVIGLFGLALLLLKPAYFKEKTPLFCILINFGVLIGYVATMTVLPEPTDKLCLAFPWLVGIAFTLIYGCLFLKTWRIFWILRASKKLQRIRLSNWYICRLIAVYFLVEVAYLVIWTVIEPPKARLVDVIDDQQQLQCASPNYALFWGIFIGYKFLWMLFGTVMAIRTRCIFDEINESKQIYYCIYNAVTVIIVGIPLVAVLSNIPFALVILEVVIIVLICTFTLVCLFFNIWMKIFSSNRDTFLEHLRNKSHDGPIEMTSQTEATKKTNAVMSTESVLSTSLTPLSPPIDPS